jgi:hypothetical protein
LTSTLDAGVQYSAEREAKAEYERLREIAENLGLNHPDGAKAAVQAAQRLSEALTAFKEAPWTV